MPQDDGLRVASAPAPAIAAWYAMFGNWIVVLLCVDEEEDLQSSTYLALKRVRTQEGACEEGARGCVMIKMQGENGGGAWLKENNKMGVKATSGDKA